MQLHLRPFYEHKTHSGGTTDDSGQTGHQRYIIWRERKERERWRFQARRPGGLVSLQLDAPSADGGEGGAIDETSI